MFGCVCITEVEIVSIIVSLLPSKLSIIQTEAMCPQVGMVKDKSAYELSGSSGRSLSQFLYHDMPTSISTPSWKGCQLIAEITYSAVAFNALVHIYTPGWSEALSE